MKTTMVAVGVLSLWAMGCAAPPYLPARVYSEVPGATAPSSATVHETEIFEGAGGAKLFAQSFRPAAGSVRGALIVVHGLKDHGGRYAELAEKCVGLGFAVYALDLRGHAHSEGVRVYVDSFDEYVSDLAAYVAKVRAREGNKPVFLFGHSMGGLIVTTFAIERKPAVSGVVLSAAALRTDASGATIFATKLTASLAPKAKVFDLDSALFSRDPEVVAAMRRDPLVYQEPGPARTAKELLAAIARLGEHMEDLEVPLLLLHGSADKVTPPEGSRELARRARAKDKTLHIYDGLVHDLLHEPEKEQVLRDVTAWLVARAPVASEPKEAP